MRSAGQSLALLAILGASLAGGVGLQWCALASLADGYVLEYDVPTAGAPQHVRFSYLDDRHWRREVTGPGGAPISIEAADGPGVWAIRRDSGMYTRFPFPVDGETGEADPFGRWGYWPGALSRQQLSRVLGESTPPYMASEPMGEDVVAGRPVVCVKYGQRGVLPFNEVCVDRELRAVLRYVSPSRGMGTLEVSRVTVNVRLPAALFALPPGAILTPRRE